MIFEKIHTPSENYSLIGRLLVSTVIFYAILITICLSGKAAILCKKFIENRKDNMQVVPILVPHNQESSVPIIIPTLHHNNNCGLNNKYWNHYLCGNSGTILLFLLIFVLQLFYFMWHWWILDLLNLNKDTSAQMIGIFNQFVTCNFIPLMFYLTNDKLYQYVKNEIKDVFYA